MTIEQYEEMVAGQKGRCAICRKKEKGGRRLSVDHNHVTTDIRALLCAKCNQGLGLFNEDPELMGRAVTYILAHGLAHIFGSKARRIN